MAMDPTTLLMAIDAARYILDGYLRQAELFHAEGKITDEQLADVKARAESTDGRWDEIAAAARERQRQ